MCFTFRSDLATTGKWHLAFDSIFMGDLLVISDCLPCGICLIVIQFYLVCETSCRR